MTDLTHQDPLPDVEGVVERLKEAEERIGFRWRSRYPDDPGRGDGAAELDEAQTLITTQQAQIEALKGERDEARRIATCETDTVQSYRVIASAYQQCAQAAEARSERLSALVGRCREQLGKIAEGREKHFGDHTEMVDLAPDVVTEIVSALLAELSEEGSAPKPSDERSEP